MSEYRSWFEDGAGPVGLSAAGAARRAAMRAELERVVVWRGRRRRAVRVLAAAAVVAAVWLGWRGQGEPAGPVPERAPAVAAAPAIRVLRGFGGGPAIRRIADDPAVLGRVRAASDRAFVAKLREHGLDAGVIRLPDRVVVTGVDVAGAGD